MNLGEVLMRVGAPDAPALVGLRGVTSFGALSADAARLGSVLVSCGMEPGDRVAMAGSNEEAFVAAYLATLHVGGVAVPLNPLAPPAELERELASVEPKVSLGWGAAAGVLREAGATVMDVDLDDLPDESAARVERQDDDVAVLLFTSGTAGSPKAAMLTHGNLAANIGQVLDHPGLHVDARDAVLGALPFFHVFGLNVVLGVALAAGARTVLMERFEPLDAAAHIRDHGITVVAGVPTMFAGWLALDEHELPADAFATVRVAVSGAAELPAAVSAAFHRRFGVVLHQGYGLTEASPIVTSTALESGLPQVNSIGPPLPGVTVRLVDADGADVLTGDPGELWVHGPNVFPGYWHDQEATARALTNDGWLRTGDVAVVDDQGALRLVDRAKDLIIVSGFNVYPVEVEDVLREHPDVVDAGVVSEPSPRTGEAVVAYVQSVAGRTVDLDDLAAHAARSLARYKCPTRFEVVDEVPRAASGKLVRRELRS